VARYHSGVDHVEKKTTTFELDYNVANVFGIQIMNSCQSLPQTTLSDSCVIYPPEPIRARDNLYDII